LNNDDYKNLAEIMGLEEYRKLQEYKDTLEGWKHRAESALGDQNEIIIDGLLEEAQGKPFDKAILRKLEREKEFLACVKDSKEIVAGIIVVDESFMDRLDELEDETENLDLDGNFLEGFGWSFFGLTIGGPEVNRTCRLSSTGRPACLRYKIEQIWGP
jgi:hypothetical protein